MVETVYEFSFKINLSVEKVLEFCKELKIDAVDENDLLYEDDINKLIEYIKNLSNLNNNVDDDDEPFVADLVEDLIEYTGFDFEPERAAAAFLSLSNLTGVLSDVKTKVESASSCVSCLTYYSTCICNINWISMYIGPFVKKFSAFIDNMCRLDPTFAKIFDMWYTSGGEIDSSYLDSTSEDFDDKYFEFKFLELWCTSKGYDFKYYSEADLYAADPELWLDFADWRYCRIIENHLVDIRTDAGVELRSFPFRDGLHDVKKNDENNGIILPSNPLAPVVNPFRDYSQIDNFLTEAIKSDPDISTVLDKECPYNSIAEMHEKDPVLYNYCSMNMPDLPLYYYQEGVDNKKIYMSIDDAAKASDELFLSNFGKWSLLRDSSIRETYGDFNTVSELEAFYGDVSTKVETLTPYSAIPPDNVLIGIAMDLFFKDLSVNDYEIDPAKAANNLGFINGYTVGYVIYDNNENIIDFITVLEEQENPNILAGKNYQTYQINFVDPYTGVNSPLYDEIYNMMNTDPDFFSNWYQSELYLSCAEAAETFHNFDREEFAELSYTKTMLGNFLDDSLCGSSGRYNIGTLNWYGQNFAQAQIMLKLPDFETLSKAPDGYNVVIDNLVTDLESRPTYVEYYSPEKNEIEQVSSTHRVISLSNSDAEAIMLAMMAGDELPFIFSEDGKTISYESESGVTFQLLGGETFNNFLLWCGDKYVNTSYSLTNQVNLNFSDIISDNDRKQFFYILNSNGYVLNAENESNSISFNSAYDFLYANRDYYDTLYVINRTERDQEYATLHPYRASFSSWWNGAIEGISAWAYSYEAYLSGEDFRRPYTYSTSDVYRSTVSANISKRIENGEIWGGWDDLYNVGMSIADSLPIMIFSTALAMSGVGIPALAAGAITFAATTALMGSRVYVSTLNDALDRGVGNGDAINIATASALAEGAIEAASSLMFAKIVTGGNAIVNRLVAKATKPAGIYCARVFGSAIVSATVEGLEEGATEIVDAVIDRLIAGEFSNFELSMQKKMDQDPTLTEREAFLKTLDEFRGQVLEAFKGGFLSGILLGIFGGAINSVNTEINVWQISDSLLNEFNDSTNNADIKAVRNALRAGDYAKAMKSISNISSFDLSQRILTNFKLYNTLFPNGGIDPSGLYNYVSEGLTDFSNLSIKEQMSQFNKLSLSNKVSLLSLLGDKGIKLFNGLDSNTRMEVFNLLDINTKMSILSLLDESTRNSLLPDEVSFGDYIINNQSNILNGRLKIINGNIDTCNMRIRALLAASKIKIGNLDFLLDKINNNVDAIKKFRKKFSNKVSIKFRSEFNTVLDLLEDLVHQKDAVNALKYAKIKNFGDNNANLDAEKLELALLIFPDAKNILLSSVITDFSKDTKTDTSVQSVNTNQNIYRVVAELLNTDNIEEIFDKYKDDPNFDDIKNIYENISKKINDFSNSKVNDLVYEAKRKAVIDTLMIYFDLLGLKITESKLSKYIGFDGTLTDQNIGDLCDYLAKRNNKNYVDVKRQLIECINGDMFIQDTYVEEGTIIDSVIKATENVKNKIISMLATGSINGLNAYLGEVLGSSIDVNNLVVESDAVSVDTAVNNAVADILSTENPMETLKQYEGNPNYDAISEKLNAALKVADKVFDAQSETEMDIARRDTTLKVLNDYFTKNKIVVDQNLLVNIIGSMGIDINNVEGTRTIINNLGKMIADLTGRNVQDVVNDLYLFIQSSDFVNPIMNSENAVLGKIQAQSELILENLVFGIENGTITDINAYLNEVLNSYNMDISVESVFDNGIVNNELSVSNSDIDTSNVETSGTDHFNNVSGVVPIALKSDTDDMGNNKSDRKMKEKDNRTYASETDIINKLNIDDFNKVFSNPWVRNSILSLLIKGKLNIENELILNRMFSSLEISQIKSILKIEGLKIKYVDFVIKNNIKVGDVDVLLNILDSVNTDEQMLSILNNCDIVVYTDGKVNVNISTIVSNLVGENSIKDFIESVKNADSDNAIISFIKNYKKGTNSYSNVNNVQFVNAFNAFYNLLASKGINVDSLNGLYDFTRKFNPSGINMGKLKVNFDINKLWGDKQNEIKTQLEKETGRTFSSVEDAFKAYPLRFSILAIGEYKTLKFKENAVIGEVVNRLIADMKFDEAKAVKKMDFQTLKAKYPDLVKQIAIDKYKEIVRNDKMGWPDFQSLAIQYYCGGNFDMFTKLTSKQQNEYIENVEKLYKKHGDVKFAESRALDKYDAVHGDGSFALLSDLQKKVEIDNQLKELTDIKEKLIELEQKMCDDIAQGTIKTIENLINTGAIKDGFSFVDILLMVQDQVSPAVYLKPEVIGYWRNSLFDGLPSEMVDKGLIKVYFFQSATNGVLKYGGAIGRPGEGAFATSYAQLQEIMDPANGIFDANGVCISRAKLTNKLGGVQFGDGEIILVEQVVPIDAIRMPSGDLLGAFTGDWCPGGFNSGLAIELISPPTKIDFSNLKIVDGVLFSTNKVVVDGITYPIENRIRLLQSSYGTNLSAIQSLRKMTILMVEGNLRQFFENKGILPKNSKKSFNEMVSLDLNLVQQYTVDEYKLKLKKELGSTISDTDLENICKKNIAYIQQLINNNLIPSDVDVYDVLRMLTFGVKLENIISLKSLSGVDISWLFSNNNVKQHVINEVLNGNILISDSSVLLEVIKNIDFTQFYSFFENSLFTQSIIDLVSKGSLKLSKAILDDIIKGVNGGIIVNSSYFDLLYYSDCFVSSPNLITTCIKNEMVSLDKMKSILTGFIGENLVNRISRENSDVLLKKTFTNLLTNLSLNDLNVMKDVLDSLSNLDVDSLSIDREEIKGRFVLKLNITDEILVSKINKLIDTVTNKYNLKMNFNSILETVVLLNSSLIQIGDKVSLIEKISNLLFDFLSCPHSLLDSSKTIVEVAINNGYNINDITLINESGNIDESKFKKFVKQMSNYDTRVIYKFNEFILTDTIFKMARAGKSVFEIARYASKARNSVRLISQNIMFDAIDQSLIAGTNGWNIEYRTTFINKLIKTDKSFYNELCKRVEKILSTEELSQFKKDGLIDYLKRRLTVNEELRNIVFDFYDSIIDENGNPRDSKLSNIVENIWYSVLEGSVKANNSVDTCFGLAGYQNEYTFAIAKMYKYGLNVSNVNQIIELAKKNGVKTNSMSIDDIVSKNISYIQSLMDNGMINSSFDLYGVLRMLITGIPFKDILNFNSITTVADVQLLLSSNEFKQYIINEVISGNIVISNDYILLEIVNNMDSIQFKNSFNNRVLGQTIIRFIKDGFLDVSSSILDDIVSDINAGFL